MRTATLLLLAAAIAALDDFERQDPGLRGLGAAQVALVPAEGRASGTALSLGWPAAHGRWVECVYAKPIPVADLARGTPVLLRAALRGAAGATGLGVRLLDARNEVWQWTTRLDGTPAWRDIAVPLSLERADGHWAGDNDGVPQTPLRLLGFSVSFADEGIPAGAVLIDDLVAEPVLRAALETDRFPQLVDTRCELVLREPQGRAAVIDATASATDWSGARTEKTARLAIPAGGEARLPLPLGARRGLHRLAWTLDRDGIRISGAATVARTDAVPTGDRDGFRFGICSHTEAAPPAEQERELRAAAAAGATVVRCGAYWSTIEPKPGAWNWQVQDRLVDLAAGFGLETQPILGFTATHAASPAAQAAAAEAWRRKDAQAWKLTALSPPDDAAWRRYVAAMAARYRGRIRMYEVWNEPDLDFWRGSTEDYLRILASAADEIRRADPAAQVLSGGFATALEHAGRARNPDLQRRVLAEGGASFDVHAFHGHGPFDEFVRGLAVLDGWRAAMPAPRPLYFNETALSAYGGGATAERTQARELVKKMAWAASLGALGYTWYELRDGGRNPADPEHHYGLLDADLQPKPAFCAYAETVRRLRGARPLGRLDLGPGVVALAFAQPARRVLVLWREGRDAADTPWLLRAGAARRCDLMGEGADLPVVDGRIALQPDAEPVFIELPPGDAAPEVAGPLLRLVAPSEVEDGSPAACSVSGDPSVPVRIAWTGADGAAQEQRLQGVPLPLRALVGGGADAAITLTYQAEGAPWQGRLRVPVRRVRSIPAAAMDGRGADFTLAGEDDVVSFCRADPNLAAQVWSGPADLSAQVWLALDGDVLRLRVIVRDDIHHQAQEPAMQWRGDGVQFAIRPPGGGAVSELGIALHDDGRILRHAWSGPPASGWEGSAVRTADGVRYDVAVPTAALGLDAAALRDGFGFNLIVNDDDGPLREGFVRIAPGIGESKDPAAFPSVRFRP